MNTDRSRFLHYFFKRAAGLQYALLKNVHATLDEIPEQEDIRVLIKKKERENFLEIVAGADGIKSLQVTYRPYREVLHIRFYDNTKVEMQLVKGLVHKAIACMSANEVLEEAELSDEQVKIPAPQHCFEYIMLSFMLNRNNMQPEFREHFSTYSIETRNKIFLHLREKYLFDINTLDDLYDFHRHYLRRIKIRLGLQKANKTIRKVYRYALYPFYMVMNLFYSRPIEFKFRPLMKSPKDFSAARHVAQ